MEYIQISTEQTTAITNVIVCVGAIFISSKLFSLRSHHYYKTLIWFSGFIFIVIASLLGAIVHGIVLTEYHSFILWQGINLALGFAVAIFFVGSVYDLKGHVVLHYVWPLMFAVVVSFYALTLYLSFGFFLFLIYEAIFLLMGLTIYLRLAYRGFPGALLISKGIVLSLIAAAVGNESLFFQLIWDFNQDSVYHLTQLLGLFFIYLGLKKSFPFMKNGSKIRSKRSF